MQLCSRIISRITITALLFILGGTAHGGPLDNLTSNSPFAPMAGVAIGSSDALPLEFRGMFVDAGETFFSIFDPATRTSLWVELNETGNGFTLRSYDESKQSVTAEFKGRMLTLVLKKAPMVSTAPGAVPMPSAGAGPPIPNATSGSPAEEAGRMAAVAAEIRRRRELRQRGGAQSGPGAAKVQ